MQLDRLVAPLDQLLGEAPVILGCREPALEFIYSDEDKIGFDGARTMAYFKCDWNYDLFLSHNLITHLGVYRADLVRDIGGFREGFEGAQDYDLALRFIERIEPSTRSCRSWWRKVQSLASSRVMRQPPRKRSPP